MEQVDQIERTGTKRKAIIGEGAEIIFEEFHAMEQNIPSGGGEEVSQDKNFAVPVAKRHVSCYCRDLQPSHSEAARPKLSISVSPLASNVTFQVDELVNNNLPEKRNGNVSISARYYKNGSVMKAASDAVCHCLSNPNTPASSNPSQTSLENSSKDNMPSFECILPHVPISRYALRSSRYDSSLCRKCSQQIIINKELLLSLIDERNVFRVHNKTQLRDTIREFSCRICGNRFLRYSSAQDHVLHHGAANDIWYCLECQKDVINFGIEEHPHPPNKEQLIASHKFKGLLMMTEECSLRGVSITHKPICPICGVCGITLGYVGHVLNKLLDANVAIYRLESGEYRKIHHYICCLCLRVGQNKQVMKRHLLSHIENGELLCKVCKHEKQKSNNEYTEWVRNAHDNAVTATDSLES